MVRSPTAEGPQSATLTHMESEVGVRALQQHASAVVRQVAAGEPVTITDRGRPVARLVPLVDDPLSRLVAEGQATLATSSVSELSEPLEMSGEHTLGEILEASRRDER